jgi:hypothetical protein
MGKQTRILKEIPIVGGNTKANILEVDLDYQLGGWNYFTGVKEPRGLYLGCTPIEKGDGFRSFVGFSGTKILVKEMSRFSKKQLDEFVPDEETVQKLINHVVAKNSIELGEE